MKREIGKLWGIRHLEVVPIVAGAWLARLGIGITIRKGLLQKTALLARNSKDSKDGVRKLKEKE